MPQGMKKAALQQQQTKASLYNAKRLLQYTPEEIDHCERSKSIKQYIDAKKIQAKNTGLTYKTRLQAFSQFVFKNFDRMEIDRLIEDMKNSGIVTDPDEKEQDVYNVLTALSGFLRQKKGITGKPLSANFIRACVKTCRKFLRFHRIQVALEDFNELVPLPRKEWAEKSPIDKADVCRYLNSTKNIQLRTAIHMLGATGPRPIEACAVKESYVDLESNPATVTFPAKYSKMRRERKRPLTTEAANQFRLWKAYKYRTRRTTVKVAEGKYRQQVVTPEPDPDSLFLSMPRLGVREDAMPEGLYDNLAQAFGDLVDMVDGKPRKKGERRKVSLKTFRDFVKSEIADLGYSDFSEWMIGHSGSTYYQKSWEEILKTFRKIEPYISYLDVASLEAHGATVEAKLDASEERFQQLLAQNEKQEMRNQLLTAVILATSEQTKAEALGRLRAFYGLDAAGMSLFQTQNLEVADRLGAVKIQSRPKIVKESKDGNVFYERAGEYVNPETGKSRLFMKLPPDTPPDVEVIFRGRKKKSEGQQ